MLFAACDVFFFFIVIETFCHDSFFKDENPMPPGTAYDPGSSFNVMSPLPRTKKE